MSDQERAAVRLALRLAARDGLLDGQNTIYEFRRVGVASELLDLAEELLGEAHSEESHAILKGGA